MAPITEIIKGRRLVCHVNLLGDGGAYGAEYVDEDVVVDGDFVTARTGAQAHLFACKLIEMINARAEVAGHARPGQLAFKHTGSERMIGYWRGRNAGTAG